MKRNLNAIIILISVSISTTAQKIQPYISARVDTSKIEINKIYHLYSNYLNSRPDSGYANPYWNEKEYFYYLNKGGLSIDRSANVMFYDGFKELQCTCKNILPKARLPTEVGVTNIFAKLGYLNE